MTGLAIEEKGLALVGKQVVNRHFKLVSGDKRGVLDIAEGHLFAAPDIDKPHLFAALSRSISYARSTLISSISERACSSSSL